MAIIDFTVFSNVSIRLSEVIMGASELYGELINLSELDSVLTELNSALAELNNESINDFRAGYELNNKGAELFIACSERCSDLTEPSSKHYF